MAQVLVMELDVNLIPFSEVLPDEYFVLGHELERRDRKRPILYQKVNGDAHHNAEPVCNKTREQHGVSAYFEPSQLVAVFC